VNGQPSAVDLPERYVNACELADRMGVSVSTIKRWVAEGMPSETWGMKRTRRYLPSQAIAWAQSRDTISPNHRDGVDDPHGQRQPKE
jgi:phage terminase Nu1 subunit (DNA packaging protein)